MQTKRVLIIEDDADAADVLKAYLKRENYDVTIAGDGLSGLETARRWEPDLILLDIMLPGMSGTEVLTALRRRGDTPVIMVTMCGVFHLGWIEARKLGSRPSRAITKKMRV